MLSFSFLAVLELRSCRPGSSRYSDMSGRHKLYDSCCYTSQWLADGDSVSHVSPRIARQALVFLWRLLPLLAKFAQAHEMRVQGLAARARTTCVSVYGGRCSILKRPLILQEGPVVGSKRS